MMKIQTPDSAFAAGLLGYHQLLTYCNIFRPTARREPFPGPSSMSLAEQVYNYSIFHITLCLSNMYVTMQLTQWFQPQEATIISFSKSWSTLILMTVSTRLSVLVYLATLVIPV